MKVLTAGVITIAILAVLFAGCTSQAPASSGAVTPVAAAPATTTSVAPAFPPQLAGDWVLTTMGVQEGTAVTYPTTEITLSFSSDGNVSGNGGCNNYFGPYTLTGTTTTKGSGITIGPIGSTKMYCTDYSKQESTYFEMLQDAAAYDADSTLLTLTGSTGDVLVFRPPSAIPVQTEGMLPA
ncbi:MAG: META domain-containing protein [Methanoregula sp.]|jgi:heat shock protein HslJ|uniref:META domain-containing protein n=1 Tax=Methanoregula sp. TaxID=2052170 RepID=UPI0025D3A55C|nr:META domain-containing protein [Methanoregula sp.]MCK9630908.1 META domain-containing protein [Methanoregula sp.]